MAPRSLRAVVGVVALMVASIPVMACSGGGSASSGTSGTVELMAALKKKSIPGIPDPLTPEKILEIEKMRTGPGAWFVQTGCFACHSVAVYGVTGLTVVGPDLSTAVEDVESRLGMSIDKFMYEPVGTMSLVLSQYIVLSTGEKAVALQKLRDAFAEHQRQKQNKQSRLDDVRDPIRGERSKS